MLSFFKRKDKDKDTKIEKHGSDSVVDSKELLGENGPEASEEETVRTNLYFTPDMKVSQEEHYYFSFLHNALPPLKPNQISLAGIELKQDGPNCHVVAFVRSTLPRSVRFNALSLLLLGPNGERLGRKAFNLNQLGELPANSSTPWLFVFDAASLTTDNIPKEGWKLAFEIKPKHQLDLAESWETHLPQEEKDKLAELVKNIQPPNEGEVNIMGLTGQVNENGNLHTTVLIRNGNNYDINLEQLPLFIADASGEVVAKGVFQLEDFKVKGNSSKPWTFIFPKEMKTKEDLDLSSWKAFIPNKQ